MLAKCRSTLRLASHRLSTAVLISPFLAAHCLHCVSFVGAVAYFLTSRWTWRLRRRRHFRTSPSEEFSVVREEGAGRPRGERLAIGVATVVLLLGDVFFVFVPSLLPLPSFFRVFVAVAADVVFVVVAFTIAAAAATYGELLKNVFHDGAALRISSITNWGRNPSS
eukprot:CAMPEP_0194350868 /NCGR_PEP_ID=MMETSP0171-20130528/107871_1 /TAXON_ID=218684 /ORGANISM="Corethron pennatum, Strain L29A3" /LENGTH=165 /DNA_ID=CAMNT_0039118451 /DNA_START=561 /DNA_END=1055 /DNA_ORIENTATION=+